MENREGMPINFQQIYARIREIAAGADEQKRTLEEKRELARSLLSTYASELDYLKKKVEAATAVDSNIRCAAPMDEPLTATFAPPASVPDTLRYRLSTEVPDYWVPLLPVKTNQGLRLKRGAVLKTDGVTESVHAQGRILESGQELSLFEEEVPREGMRVTRSYQFTRWIDGSSHFWVGRRKGIGRGEGSSGLKFDSLDGKERTSESG